MDWRMLFLVPAILAGDIALAASQEAPVFNVDPNCRAAAREAPTSESMAICQATEQRAREEIVRQWSEVSAAEKAQCVPLSTLGGTPTYTELLTCIELTREAKRLRSQEPTTTGQAVR